MKHIFVDFEMHPIAKEFQNERKICPCEIIEFGAVMLDDDFIEISSFKELDKSLVYFGEMIKSSKRDV